MAIAFDAITYGHDINPGTSLSWNHTATGSDLLLLAGVQGSTTTDKVSGVTVGGNAMTKVTAVQGSSGRWISLWWAAVSAGTLAIVVSSSSDYIQGVSATYTGCAATGQPDASHTNSAASATTLSDSVTPVATGCWTVMFTRLDSNGGPGNAGAAPTTKRLGDPDFDSWTWLDSNGTVSAGSAQTLQCNAGGIADPMADIIVSIAPVGAVGGGRKSNLLTMGVSMLPLMPAWWRFQRMHDKKIQQAARECLHRKAA